MSACDVLRGLKVRVAVVVGPFTIVGATVMNKDELALSPSELSHCSWAGLLLTAVQVRVSLVPATTGFSCEALILRECSSSEWTR